MSEHNLFNQYEPSLQYHSIFRYFQVPCENRELIDDNASKRVSFSEKLMTSFIIVFMYLVVLVTFPITGFFIFKVRIKI